MLQSQKNDKARLYKSVHVYWSCHIGVFIIAADTWLINDKM